MAGELRRLEFAVTTLDIEHWHPGWLAAAETWIEKNPGHGYHDWIVDQLHDAMRKAAQEFIDKHPDLFACELT